MNPVQEKLCVAIGNCTLDDCRKIVQSAKLCELRLDLLKVNDHLRELLSSNAKAVVTYRAPQNDTVELRAERLKVMKEACKLGAAFIDIEIEAIDEYRIELIRAAKAAGTKVILSYHNFQETPPLERLREIADQCFALGADVGKVACQVKSPRDNATLIALLSDSRPMIVAGMGEEAKITRIAAPFFGSQFTYVTPSSMGGTAPGQISVDETLKVLTFLSEHGINIKTSPAA